MQEPSSPRKPIATTTGGAVNTRRMTKGDFKPLIDEPRRGKRKLEEDVDMSDLMDDELDDLWVERADRLLLEINQLFKANLTFLPYKRQGLKGAVKKQQCFVTFEQLACLYAKKKYIKILKTISFTLKYLVLIMGVFVLKKYIYKLYPSH